VIVVFDSSIWVSAVQFGGTPMLTVDLGVLEGKIATCDGIESEVRRILTKKFAWTPTRLANNFDILILNALKVPVTGAIQGVCRDPKDDMVLECAVNADADVIVTGDKDLLVLESYRNIRVITGRQYLDEYSTAP